MNYFVLSIFYQNQQTKTHILIKVQLVHIESFAEDQGSEVHNSTVFLWSE